MTIGLIEIGPVDEAVVEAGRKALAEAVWKERKGETMHYFDADVSIAIPFPKVTHSFLLKIEPGGNLHEHSDGYDGSTFHVVLETNDKCLLHFRHEGKVYDHHLAPGALYQVDRMIPHWSENGGETDRVHLIIEAK